MDGTSNLNMNVNTNASNAGARTLDEERLERCLALMATYEPPLKEGAAAADSVNVAREVRRRPSKVGGDLSGGSTTTAAASTLR